MHLSEINHQRKRQMKPTLNYLNDFSEPTFISTKQIKFQKGSNAASAEHGKPKGKEKKKDYSQERKQKRGSDMSEELVDNFLKAVSDLAVLSAALGYEGGAKNLSVVNDDMRSSMVEAYAPILQMFSELLQSRDEYQKAADAMAAEHKVEREKLIDALVRCRDAFEPPESGSETEVLWNAAMRSEDGIAAYVAAAVTDLENEADANRSDAMRNARLAVKYRVQLQSKHALNTEEILDDFCKQPHNTQYVKVFEAGVRFAEKHHGIGVKE